MITTLADLIGATLFPAGPFFAGFTLSAFLTGLIYGLILYKREKKTNEDKAEEETYEDKGERKADEDKEKIEVYEDKEFLIRLVISSVIVNVCISMLLNTYWIAVMGGKAFVIDLQK